MNKTAICSNYAQAPGAALEHVKRIDDYLDILVGSEHFNLLTIIGPPGWAKTETIRTAQTSRSVEYRILGPYSTPLALYNRLAEDPGQILVIDDSAGLLTDPRALAVLNAATWTGADGRRILTWESTSNRVESREVEFTGKLILLTNHMPASPAARALVSRGLKYALDFDTETICEALRTASNSVRHFPDRRLAKEVVAFLIESAEFCDSGQLNLRTLKNSYEIAQHCPESWQELVRGVLPKAGDENIVRSLHKTGRKAKEQYAEFHALTGKSERTFYSLRVKLGLARAQVNRNGGA